MWGLGLVARFKKVFWRPAARRQWWSVHHRGHHRLTIHTKATSLSLLVGRGAVKAKYKYTCCCTTTMYVCKYILMYMQLAIRSSVVLGIFILCITCISTSCSLHLRGGLRAFAKIERYVYGITLLHTYLLPLNSSRVQQQQQ